MMRQVLEALGDDVDGALLALDVAVDDEGRRRLDQVPAVLLRIRRGFVMMFIRPW